MRGAGQRLFGIFLKIHPIWRSHPSLRKVSLTKQGLTTDGAAGGLKDVVALPRLLDLSPRGGCACGQTSATRVTHAGEHQSLEQTCMPDSTRAAPRLHGLAFLSSTSYFYSHTPALENPKQARAGGQVVRPVVVVVGRVGSGTLPLPRWPDTTVCAAPGKAALSSSSMLRCACARQDRVCAQHSVSSAVFSRCPEACRLCAGHQKGPR